MYIYRERERQRQRHRERETETETQRETEMVYLASRHWKKIKSKMFLTQNYFWVPWLKRPDWKYLLYIVFLILVITFLFWIEKGECGDICCALTNKACLKIRGMLKSHAALCGSWRLNAVCMTARRPLTTAHNEAMETIGA